MRVARFVFLAAVLAALPARPAAAVPGVSVNLEPLRMVADWLGNGTYGVNAKIPGVQRDAGDAAPPNVALIADETRSGVVARDRIPAAAGPVLTVACLEESTWSTELEDKYRDCQHFPIAIRYADTDKVLTEVGTQNAYYTLRAVLRSLKDLMTDPGVSARVRNGVHLVNASDQVRVQPAMKQIDDKIVVAGLVVGFWVRDESP